MVVDNQPAGRVAGKQRFIGESDITEVTLSQNDWIEVFSTQSSKTLAYFPGYGIRNRNGEAGFADFDAEATGGGTAMDGDSLNVEFRYAVYNDANKDDLAARGPTLDSGPLRVAVAANATEKQLVPMHRIGAPEDGYLALEAKAKDSAADGAVLESDSSAHSGTALENGFPYTEVQV